MRRKYSLYINGTLADIATDALVLMNYKQTDATAPAAVYNSWSQSVVLPRTSKNNAIFDHTYRADHVTVSGKFNALARTPFTIYNEQGEILESGYLKLTDMTETQYNATLYGGLGGFLFGLMYNPDGSKRSLADLVYTSGGDEHEFDFNITRDAVRAAWRHLAGLQTQLAPWGYINFAPCYNGLPGGDFDSKTAFVPSACYGVSASQGNYTDRRSHVKVSLAGNVDEWAAQDLRSYLQRPVLSVRRLLDALTESANNGGYSVTLDPDFFRNTNPYYWNAWLTLPKFEELQLPSEHASGSGTVAPDPNGAKPANLLLGGDIYTDIAGPWEDVTRPMAKYSAALTFAPSIVGIVDSGPVVTSWQRQELVSGSYVNMQTRIVAVYQLLAYDADGNVIGGSDLYGVSTLPNGTPPFNDDPTDLPTFLSGWSFGGLQTYSYGWGVDSEHQFLVQGKNYQDYGLETKVLTTSDGLNIQNITLAFTDVQGVSKVRLRTTYLAATITPSKQYTQVLVDMVPLGTSTTPNKRFDNVNFYDGALTYSYDVDDSLHSGAAITKKLLLGGSNTPADYLLSYLKTFGLCLTYDAASKSVGIMLRNTFFTGNEIDLEDRIDVTTRKTVPFSITSRWYDWQQKVTGRFADYYLGVRGRTYGSARVNTGFEFNADHNDVLKDCVFKGAAEVLRRDKYMINITEDGKVCPPPFIDGGKYTLWGSDGSTSDFELATPTDAAVIDYLNAAYHGYDYDLAPKPEFCDKDGKGLDGSDVLLIFDSCVAPAEYARLTLTDDNVLMTLYNEGAPCWLLGESVLAAQKYKINDGADSSSKLYLPRFRRMRTGQSDPMTVTTSMDMDVPAEVDQPEITVPSNVAIFSRAWAAYIADLMDVDARVLTCKVDLNGLQVRQDLLRNFFYFEGCLWVLSEIKNHDISGDGLTECVFIKVKDQTNYTNGQTY